MAKPLKFTINKDIKETKLYSELLKNKFRMRNGLMVTSRDLYKNMIRLTISVDKSERTLHTEVSDQNGLYGAFYDPAQRHDNAVANYVIEEYNKVMTSFVKSGLLEFEEDYINDKDSETIKIKYHTDKIEKLRYIDGKSDWIDLRAAEEVTMKAGDFKLISLGVSMKLPAGYEAHVIPRSSTYKNFKIIMANSMGMIDESFSGSTDIWKFPALAIKDTIIHVNDRICQFRIMKHQPPIEFEESNLEGEIARGGIGSTGKN